jgi:hypothetical protein
MKRSVGWIVLASVAAAGCAGGLGRGGPLQRDAIAWQVPAGTSAEQLGARLQQGGYEFAMLSANQDSAWLAAAASRAGLQMTRPGRVGGSTYTFFGPKPVGDTTHVIQVQGGGRIRLHDALYRIDKNRIVDLILARFDSVTVLNNGVRSLLEYVGSDVSGSAGLLLGIEVPSAQAGDSVATLVRAYLTDARECASGAPATTPAIRVFYGPRARLTCQRAEVLNEAGGPVSAAFALP